MTSINGRLGAVVLCLVLAGCGDEAGRGRGPRDAGVRTDARAMATCTDPRDSDGDGIADAAEGTGDSDADGRPNNSDDDSDGDGILDSAEARSSMPCAPADSDGDSLPDFADTDSDNDGLTDAEESGMFHTDPTNRDSDGDGFSDLAEARGSMTDPLDPTSRIPDTDFYVVLPYLAPMHEFRELRFGTNISVADVFFLMDTTGSMYSEVGNVQMGMETVIIPGVQALIRDVQFGAGGFDDFPVGSHGGGTDRPYYHLVDIVPFTQDIGSMSGGGFAGSDVQTFAPSGSNGTPDIIDAVRSYPRHGGGNGCESGVEGLYQTATGVGVSYPGGDIPPKSCPSIPDEMGTRRGYPCFRPGALPIIVYVSDAPLHEPLPAGWPLDTLEGVSCTYTDVGSAARYDAALTALIAIGARVISLSTDSIPSNPGYPATGQMCNIARDTGAVRGDGSPLCFELGPSGTMITSSVVDAIGQLVGGTPQDVSTTTENVAGNPDGFDATRFIKAITPLEGYDSSGTPGLGYTSKDTMVFYGVIPGTTVAFTVDFYNDVRPTPLITEIHQAKIIVIGNGVARLSERRVYIIVPPEGGTVLI